MSRRFLSDCFQTLFFGGDFCFYFCYHFCQQCFTFFLAVGVDVSVMLFAVRSDWGVAALPEFFVDLADAPGARLAALAFVGLEGTGGRFLRDRLIFWLRLGFADATVDFHCRCPVHLVDDATYDGGQGLDVHNMLQGGNRKCVPLWHNKEKLENPCAASGWLVCPYFFSTKNDPRRGLRRG